MDNTNIKIMLKSYTRMQCNINFVVCLWNRINTHLQDKFTADQIWGILVNIRFTRLLSSHPTPKRKTSKNIQGACDITALRHYVASKEPKIVTHIIVATQVLQLNTHFTTISVSNVGRDSFVGITTFCGLDGPGIELRWGEIFCTRPDRPWAHPSSYTMRTMPISRGLSGRGVAFISTPI